MFLCVGFAMEGPIDPEKLRAKSLLRMFFFMCGFAIEGPIDPKKLRARILLSDSYIPIQDPTEANSSTP
jgi:hypothetical protein